jgi:hypothetical protein
MKIGGSSYLRRKAWFRIFAVHGEHFVPASQHASESTAVRVALCRALHLEYVLTATLSSRNCLETYLVHGYGEAGSPVLYFAVYRPLRAAAFLPNLRQRSFGLGGNIHVA